MRNWILRIPLPWLSILVGLICGLIAWLIIDPVQSRDLGEIFHKEQARRLEVRAADTRRRFESSLGELETGLQEVAQNWLLVDYVYSSEWEKSEEKTLILTTVSPAWLDQSSRYLEKTNPSLLIILDQDGEPREIFYDQDQPFPTDKALDLFTGQPGSVVTTLWQAPYFIAWAEIAGVKEERQAFLMLVVPLEEKLLADSQQIVDKEGVIVGLFDGDLQRVLSSSDLQRVGSTSWLETWQDQYQTTSQALARYRATDGNIQFFTMMPRARMESRLERTLTSVRRVRIFDAIVYVMAFTLTFFLISSRLSQILRRISLFGQSALGIEQPTPKKGNQLMQLESRLQELFNQVSYVRDETQEQQEFRIRESEALRDALLDNALDPIITVDNKGLIIEANLTVEETFGYSREQMLGHGLDEMIIHPKHHIYIRQLLTRCRQATTHDSLCRSQKMLGLDVHGAEKPLECSVMPINLKDRTVLTVYLRDITDREKAELQIKSLANFARENPSPVLRINSRGVITYANLASDPLLVYWGCDRGQTLPLYWRNLVFEALQDGLNREYEINLEEQIISLLMAPVLELDYVNLYGRDITQVRTAEQQSRQHQAELVHVCRVSTMGEMATGLAHELNQPLSAIVNYASGCVRRLQAGIGGEAELVDAMAQITVQAERAGEIIKRLRALVGKRPKEHAVVNLNHLVLEVASFVEFDAGRHHVDVTLELDQGGLPVEVDLVQIEQVLLNLVRNAIDAMNQVDEENRKLNLVTRKLDDFQVEVVVQDTGPGIPPNTQEHLFDAFFSTKESGMGMGLPISRKIIESHHGKLSVVSELGTGAEFSVILPTDPNLKLAGF